MNTKSLLKFHVVCTIIPWKSVTGDCAHCMELKVTGF